MDPECYDQGPSLTRRVQVVRSDCSSPVQDNILFGAEYNEERYKKGMVNVSRLRPCADYANPVVIVECGLERDLTLFEAGDSTEIGEKGVTLSGGQKVNSFRM